MLTRILNYIREFCSLKVPQGASQNKWKGGFTLIELMVVIIIVNLLSGIAIPKCTDLIEKSREKMDVLKLYYLRDALNRALYESEYDNNTLSSNKSGYTACKDVSKANLDKGLKEGLALFIIQRSKTMPVNYQGVHSTAGTNNIADIEVVCTSGEVDIDWIRFLGENEEMPKAPQLTDYFNKVTTSSATPDQDGFIRRWLLLEPISKKSMKEYSSNLNFTYKFMPQELNKEYYPGQFKKFPSSHLRNAFGFTG